MDNWLRDDVDDRLTGLFSENSEELVKTVQDLLDRAPLEPDLEEVLQETLEQGLETGDETFGLMWVCVVLGELEASDSVGVLCQALHSPDEDLVQGAVRALRRLGEPAFEMVLEQLDEEAPPDSYANYAAVLEGIGLHSLADLRDRIEHQLIRHVRSLSQALLESDRNDLRSLEQRGFQKRNLESASLALARIGVPRARQPLEQAFEAVFDQSNSYLLEALEILEEQPEGIPCSSSLDWLTEYRWALQDGLPGGEISGPDVPEGDAQESPQSGGPRF